MKLRSVKARDMSDAQLERLIVTKLKQHLLPAAAVAAAAGRREGMHT